MECCTTFVIHFMSYSLNQISILGARDQMMEEYLETADSSSGLVVVNG